MKLSLVRRNIVANAVGKGWTVLVSLAVVPVYIGVLGIEAYGLIGFFLTLMAVFSLLDLGLGTALNRQLARYSAEPAKARDMRRLLRTLEIIYWSVGVCIGLAIAGMAPWLATHWIQAGALPLETVEHALALMGAAAACQWPRALYAGGLMGMQRQVALNAVAIFVVTLQSLGGVAAVLYFRTIEALIGWYAVSGLLDTVISALLLWRALPATDGRAAFDPKMLSEVWRFAAGMTGISVQSLILTQLDKMILSKILTLEAFGYYSLAWRVASGVYYVTTPVIGALFPRFSQLAVAGAAIDIASLYHRSCQLMSVIVLPVALVLSVFSYHVLLLWTRDPVLAANASTVMSLLVLGTALNGLMGLPVALQFAYGSTRLVIVANTLAIALLAPLVYLAAVRYGGVGAAWIWLALNAGYVLFLLRLMHRTLLPNELRAWFVVDVGRPLAAVLAVVIPWKLAVGASASHAVMFSNLVGVSLVAAAAAVLAAPELRAMALQGRANSAART